MHAEEPDSELKRRFQAGEAAAIDELAVRFFADVARFAATLVADADDSMDAAQETFLRLFELHRNFRVDRAFRPWLFGICRTCCLEVRGQRARRSARVVDLGGVDPGAEQMIDSAPSAADLLVRDEIDRDALVRLGGLDEGAATIVALHLFEEMTFREIAEIVDRPAATVATIHYRALAKLRTQVERHGEFGR